MKATDEELIESYNRLNSIWKVAEEFGMCGQSVHQRLKRLNIVFNNRPITDEEREKIKKAYKTPWKCGESPIPSLALSMGRSYHLIVREAGKMGLTVQTRKATKKLKEKMAESTRNTWKNQPHPKGMLGKTHSSEYSQEFGRRSSAWWKEATDEMKYLRKKKLVTSLRESGAFERSRGSWKAGWRSIGKVEKFYRSSWEANYARYLEFLKKQGEIKDWDHEPKTFWFDQIRRGAVSYLPDFKVTRNDGSHYWVEVKGWMDDRSKTKIKRFKKYYPEEELVLIERDWFKKNSKKLRIVCRPWE